MERTYKLGEHVKDDDHCRNRDKGGEEFGVDDRRPTGEGEALRGEECCQVSCHCEEDEDELASPKGERYKAKPIAPLSDLP